MRAGDKSMHVWISKFSQSIVSRFCPCFKSYRKVTFWVLVSAFYFWSDVKYCKGVTRLDCDFVKNELLLKASSQNFPFLPKTKKTLLLSMVTDLESILNIATWIWMVVKISVCLNFYQTNVQQAIFIGFGFKTLFLKSSSWQKECLWKISSCLYSWLVDDEV